MSRPGERSYRFDAAGHWRAGAMRGFAVRHDALLAEQPLVPHRIPPPGPGILAAPGPRDRLCWLEPGTGELVTLHDFGAEPQGRIAVHAPVAIHAGPTILWVRDRRHLHRFAARSLQELGAVDAGEVVASAPDGHDGLWLLAQGKQGVAARRIDSHGRFRRRPIRLPEVRAPRALACDPARQRLAILDAADGEHAWRLHLVDLATGMVHPPLIFPLLRESGTDAGEALPAWIAIDDQGGFRLATAEVPGTLLAVSADGAETARQALVLNGPATAPMALTGLIWQRDLIACAADGLYRLLPATADNGQAPGLSASFITPVLRSPPGTPSGWNRAEMTVELPRGAQLTATIFSSSSETVVERFEQLLTDPALPVAARVARIETLFESPEVERRQQLYKGEGGQQVLQLLLDGITAPYLWLRLELGCAAGTGPASMRLLKVRYPDRSWLDDLPAIYRDDPVSAAQLRRFLAPFETLYGGIDEAIDRLPAQIHPETAAAERLPWLLGWLGFPPTMGLKSAVQRDLLKAAGCLLAGRGTIRALRTMLKIVTGHGPVTIEDVAGSAEFWVLGTAPIRLAPRLGRDTRIVTRLPRGFRPGSGMRLGEEPVGAFCSDVDRMLRARCGLVRIGIALEPGTEEVVLPIVEQLLAMFVPAHCRIDLRVARAGRRPRVGRLDRGWRLADDSGTETRDTGRLDDTGRIALGAETAIGLWRLPSPCPSPFTIDGSAALDGVRRLA